MKHFLTRDCLTEEVAALPALSLDQLKERWLKLYGTAPPKRISRQLLTYVIGYKMQEQRLGGLSVATVKVLDKANQREALAAPRPRGRPGTILIRRWRGNTHEVTVLEQGVMYRGQHHGSLSKVAKLITGTTWSGPAFFGLKSKEPSRDAA